MEIMIFLQEILSLFIHNIDSNKNSLKFFPGSWTPFIPSSNFSDYIGPIEVRKNWKIKGIDVNFD